ncbi:FG-GAP-like repeat-containing protein [Paraglaciecola sp.]|uniref:FG-GAP repeat domain-containing protein n=1 Tax=Paraglaciecola sp. TaxID=1920173 RepID=UPI003262F937
MKNCNILSLLFLSVLMTACGGGGGSDTTTTPVNLAPTANAGDDQSVNEEEVVTLSGSGTDPDGSISSYQWSQTSGTTVSLAESTSVSTTFTSPTLIDATTLTFEFSITDDDGATDKDIVEVVINPVNSAPIANAGIDQSVDENMVVTLSGSGNDSDGTVTSYKWLQTSGDNVSLSDSSSASTIFTAPSLNANATYAFQLSVSDNEGGSTTDIVSIEIKNVDGSFASTEPLLTLPQIEGYGIVSDIVNLDLNDDGLEDLVIFSTSDVEPIYTGVYIQALINKGDGSFIDQSNTYFPNISNSSWKWVEKVYTVDLNNDGLEDLVGHVDLGFEVLPPLVRKQDGSFEIFSGTLQRDDLGGFIPIDIDADGDIDLLRRTINHDPINGQKHDIMLLTNITDVDNVLEFEPISEPINDNKLVGIDNSTFAYAPVVFDINNDGLDDLLMSGPKWKGGFVEERAPIYAFLNSGENSLIESTATVFPSGIPTFTHLRELALADIDNSGNLSVIVANHGYDSHPWPGENNAVLKNLGDGTFIEDIGDANSHDYYGFTHSTTVGDIDNDGDVDIVYAEYGWSGFDGTNSIRILENDGAGNFTKRFFSATKDLITQHLWTSSLLIDLNKDGYPELVLGSADSETNNLIFWNDGSGNFQVDEL